MSLHKFPPRLVVGLGAVRQTGKDTLACRLHELDSRFTRYAFADPLREELDLFLRVHYGVNIWNCTPEEKELVRPLLIAHGMIQRARAPDYWVSCTVRRILTELERATEEFIPVIVDVRFSNELTILREVFPNFRFINLRRDGAPPPTSEEEKHYPALEREADYSLHWGNNTKEGQLARAQEVLDWLAADLTLSR